MKFLSYIPFERELFDLNILNETEVNWINKYHAKVYEKLSSKLKLDQKELGLKNATLQSKNQAATSIPSRQLSLYQALLPFLF